MIITDEPGIYRAGRHGVRIENDLLVVEDTQNEFGKFFENLSRLPMFRLILMQLLPEKMSDEEKKMLNEYHAAVYEKVGMYLEENEREWLKRYTRPI